MATRSVVCPECGAEVPAGRLSCAACGTLLASVAGAVRRPVASAPGTIGETGTSLIGAVVGRVTSSRGARKASTRAAADGADRPIPPILHEWTGPLPSSLTASTSPASAVSAPATSGRRASTGGASRRRAARPAELVQDAPPEIASIQPEPDAPLLRTLDPEPDVDPDIGPDLEFDEDAPLGSAVRGSYVPRGAVPTAAAMIDGRPSTASTIAAVSIAHGTVASVAATPRPDRWFSVPVPGGDASGTPGKASLPEDASSTPGKAGIFSDLPFKAPLDVAGWAVAVGALLGSVAFLLPWAAYGVMGTQFEPTYTGQWGLANPADLIPMAVAITLLLMTLIPNRIPSWIRGAIVPIVVGGWFVGIAWSYATGPFGLGWGVDAVAIGGVVLVIGGVLGQRHLEATAAAEAKADPDPA
jgi:hypothetical protein